MREWSELALSAHPEVPPPAHTAAEVAEEHTEARGFFALGDVVDAHDAARHLSSAARRRAMRRIASCMFVAGVRQRFLISASDKQLDIGAMLALAGALELGLSGGAHAVVSHTARADKGHGLVSSRAVCRKSPPLWGWEA